MKYSLLFIAFVICFKPVLPFMEYALDYDYISKVLCINKDKPELKCNGKCYVMQQLAKELEADNKTEKTYPIEYCLSLLFFDKSDVLYNPMQLFEAKDSKIASSYNKRYTFIFYEELIKPPEA